MNHLKIYEYYNNELKEGDYILVDMSDINTNFILKNKLPSDNLHQPAKLIKILDDEFGYKCLLKNDIYFHFSKEEIIRKLNNDEIENFKININSKKYNL